MATSKKKVNKQDPADIVAVDIHNFQALLQHPGWMRLALIMDRNMDLMRDQIVDKRALDGTPLSNEEVDRLRDRLDNLKEIRTAPERYVRMLTEKGEEAVIDEYDPYAKAGESPG